MVIPKLSKVESIIIIINTYIDSSFNILSNISGELTVEGS